MERRTSPETALFRAIILQIFLDLGYKGSSRQGRIDKMQAENFVLNKPKELRYICDHADVHPRLVKETAERILKEGLVWRAPAGKGKEYLKNKLYRERKRKKYAIKC